MSNTKPEGKRGLLDHILWRKVLVLCILPTAIWSSRAEGAYLFIDALKYSEPAYETNIQVDLADVAGVTGVQVQAADSTLLTLDSFAPGQFAHKMGPYGTFTAFHTATVGNWRLIITFGGSGDAEYDFAVNDFRTPFTSNSFPPAPTVLSPADGATGVDPTPTFQWNNGGAHTGTMESLFVSVWSEVNPAVGQFENSFGGSITLNAQTWTPSVVLPAGAASFLVQYETNEDEGANVDDPIFDMVASTVADPGIIWNSTSGDLFSRDIIEFTVLPEPASVTILLLGTIAVLRRRKK